MITRFGSVARKSRFLILLAVLVVAAGAIVKPALKRYDSADDIGLVAESHDAAGENCRRLNAALAAGRYVVLPPGQEYFVEGTILTGTRIGGGLASFAAPGYQSPNSSPIGCDFARLTRIDSDKGGAIIRIRGNAFTLRGIELRGRAYAQEKLGEGAVDNPKPKCEIGIEFESRPATGAGAWTGLHKIGPVLISECAAAMVVLGGYYEDAESQDSRVEGQKQTATSPSPQSPASSPAFHKYEGNNDNVLVEGAIISNCDVGAKFENEQAICWEFRKVVVFGWGGRSLNHFVMCDVFRGGDITINSLSLNHVDACVFKCRDFNPNAPSYVCRDLKWDHVPSMTPGRLTLFEYAGRTDDPNNSWQKFRVRVDGGINNTEVKIGAKRDQLSFDPAAFVRIPKAAQQFPLEDLLFDIGMMPREGFESAGGPWFRPTAKLLY